MMPKNLIVLRASPDWTRFDIEATRPFLRRFNLPETLIIEFDALWRRHFRTDYRTIRAELKALALQTYQDVRGALLLRNEDWSEIVPSDGWVAFVDDDDWMSPALFESIPAPAPNADGALWGSLRLGRVFASGGNAEPIMQWRPHERIVYTNNYAVSSHAVKRFSRPSLFEHGDAQTLFDRADFAFTTIRKYLSCAVKHPCSTMSIIYLMSLESFRSDPRSEMSRFAESLEAVNLDNIEGWTRPPFRRFREIMSDALLPASG
jgi:hypothetical protein